MTIEQYLGKSADELEAMSQQDIETYFSIFLPKTRPDLIDKTTTTSTVRIASTKSSKKRMAEDILAQYGFKLKL